MKTTKNQLKRIIQEEQRMHVFRNNVRRSMIMALVSEGLIHPRNTRMLVEAADADMEALEAAVMKGAKKAGAIGKLGIKALAAFIKPVAKQAISVAGDTGKWGIKNVGPALAGMGKFVGNAAGGALTGIKDLIGGLKSETDFRKLAETKPDEFKKIHAAYIETFEKLELPVTNAKSAAALIGISETEEGKEVLSTAAKRGGTTPDDLVSQLNLFGQMAKHLDAANESDAKSGVSENRKVELESLVKNIFESTDEQDEGNAFSGARQDAIDNDEDEFEVSGKTYKVKGQKNESREPWLQMINEEHRAAELEMLVEQMMHLNENKAIMLMLKPLFKEAGKKIVPMLLDLLKDAGKDVVEELVGKLGEEMGGAA